MKKYLLIIISTVYIFSCGTLKQEVQENVETHGNLVTRYIAFPVIAGATFLTEAAVKVFKNESFETGDSFYIRSLQAKFLHNPDTLYFRFDSIKVLYVCDSVISFKKFLIKDDSIILKDLDFSSVNGISFPDTLNAEVRCEYDTDALFDEDYKCIRGFYIIESYDFTLKEPYETCKK